MKGTAKSRVDGFITLQEGANATDDPVDLPDSQYAAGSNISCRGGLIKNRPGFTKAGDLNTGLWQHGRLYRLNSEDRFVYTVAGHVYGLRLSDLTTDDYGLEMSPTASTCYYVKADEFFVVQDGVSTPLILQGASVLTANINDDPTLATYRSQFKKGTIMGYGHGRIFLVPVFVPDNNGVDTDEDGRPYFLASTVIKPHRKRDVLLWDETDYLNEGGALGMSGEFGFVQAMIFFRNAQTATGIGTLIVFAYDGASSFAVNIPRAQWKNQDLSQTLFSGSGTRSPSSPLPVNDDILYLDKDGVHTLRYQVAATAGQSGVLSNVPISAEVDYLFKLNTKEDLPFVSSAFVDNRVYFTCGGRNDDGSFKALAVLDVNLKSKITARQATPVWNGSWSGLHILQVFSGFRDGKEVVYLVVKNGENNELWFIDEDAIFDNGTTKIKSRLYTKGYVHRYPEGSATELKVFDYLQIWVKGVVGEVTLRAYYRSDGYPFWSKTRTHTIKASTSGFAQIRRPIQLAPIDDTVDNSTSKQTRVGGVFQYCIEWEGQMTIKAVKMFGHVAIDPVPECDDEATVVELTVGENQVELDDFDYEVL